MEPVFLSVCRASVHGRQCGGGGEVDNPLSAESAMWENPHTEKPPLFLAQKSKGERPKRGRGTVVLAVSTTEEGVGWG